MNELLNKIAERTGRKPVSCTCADCRSQCRVPCIGTPDDMLEIIKAGHADKLEFHNWNVGYLLGKLPAPITIIRPKVIEGSCAFFKNNLCELHESGLKPTEGKLSYHTLKLDNFIFELSLSWNVAQEWIRLDNLPKIIKLIFFMRVFKASKETEE